MEYSSYRYKTICSNDWNNQPVSHSYSEVYKPLYEKLGTELHWQGLFRNAAESELIFCRKCFFSASSLKLCALLLPHFVLSEDLLSLLNIKSFSHLYFAMIFLGSNHPEDPAVRYIYRNRNYGDFEKPTELKCGLCFDSCCYLCFTSDFVMTFSPLSFLFSVFLAFLLHSLSPNSNKHLMCYCHINYLGTSHGSLECTYNKPPGIQWSLVLWHYCSKHG